MSNHFFGLQVAVLAPPHDPWRTRLLSLLRQHTRDQSLVDQRGFLGALANLLLLAEDRMPLGFWDLQHEGKAEYDDWVRGIEDDSAEPWVPDGSGARLDHVLVSALFLLPQGGASAQRIGERCDLPEAQWMQRRTFHRLFETLPQFDARSVRGNAVYVTPGGDRLGFSLRELQGEGYDYLLPISG